MLSKWVQTEISEKMGERSTNGIVKGIEGHSLEDVFIQLQ